MVTLNTRLVALLLATTCHVPVFASQAPPAPAPVAEEAEDEVLDDLDDDVIVVTGRRLRGQVLGDIPPELTLNEEEIRAFGASSLADLLEALTPQTRSGRGRGGERPVILLNGRRISSFSEIRGIPPEALERVEVLPEEVALRYGYRADQRVVNFILRENFRAVTAEATYGFPTAGGRSSYGADVNYLQLRRDGRFNIETEYRRDTFLLESERDILPATPARPFDLGGNVAAPAFGTEIDPALSALAGFPVSVAAVPPGLTAAPGLAAFAPGANAPAVTDLGPFRSLLPSTEQVTVNGTVNRIFGDVSASLNARVTASDSTSLLGLPSASLIVPAANPFSPFARDVVVHRYFDATGPLRREVETRGGNVGLSINGDILPWRWSLTANYERSNTLTLTETGLDLAAIQARIAAGDPALNPFAPLPGGLVGPVARNESRTINQLGNAELVLNGPIVDLPAGPLSASIRAGAEARGIESRALRAGFFEERDLSRQRANLQGSFDLPIASRRTGTLEALGSLSLNLNASLDHLSDFGTLRTLGAGINWSPVAQVTLIASVTDEDGAPTMQQLGDPTIETPNVRIFDFARGETVDVTRIDGGNPALIADNRRVFRLGVNARPLEDGTLTLSANYVNSRIRDPIAAFPAITSEIEAAFPERFVRGADGRLLLVDARPINFARIDRQELRWGVNLFRPIGPQAQRGGPGAMFGGGGGGGGRGAGQRPEGAQPRQRPEGAPPRARGEGAPAQGERPAGEQEAAPPAPRPQRPPGARGPGGGGGRGAAAAMFGGGGGGRLQLSLYHTWRFQDEILIRPGGPLLDLLGGSAVGNRGGRPSHEIEFQAGLFRNGLGARLTANWQESTFVRGGPDGSGGTAGDLFFSDLFTVNLRLFANLGEQEWLVRQHPWLGNTRVTLALDNLLDTRVRVRDEAGATPFIYQPGYIDPLGRTLRLSIRKQF